mgnify:CR=1 FL=1
MRVKYVVVVTYGVFAMRLQKEVQWPSEYDVAA